ncbi:MAG: polysulfide reductase NrfD [Acidobacteria bacterium]|nr:polysulfide reductase NrfD [Acidobacteriota bacterium]
MKFRRQELPGICKEETVKQWDLIERPNWYETMRSSPEGPGAPRRPFPVWIFFIPVLLIAAGLFFYLRQLEEGLGVTGLNTQVTWGIYIVNFIFCVGLSAGGIAVSGLVHACRIRELKPVALIAEILALSFLVMAAICIILDMGRPERALFVLLHSNLRSPLLWDATVISVYLALCVALLWSSLRSELQELPQQFRMGPLLAWVAGPRTEETRARNERLLRRLSIISIPGALALHSVTAWILGLAKGQPGWNTAILAPLFIASALVSGIGVVILGAGAARRFFGLPIPVKVIESLGRYLFLLLPVLIYFLFSEFLTVSYTGGLSHQRVMQEIIWGRFSKFFWFDMLVGILIPVFLRGFFKRSQMAIQVASLLAVVGVLAERVNILLPSLMRFDPLHAQARYVPSVPELVMVAAVYGLGMLIFCGFGYTLSRLENTAEESEAVRLPSAWKTRQAGAR